VPEYFKTETFNRSTTTAWLTLTGPKIICTLHITPSFSVSLTKVPNRFHRWMTTLLLGWRWEML
jgi:hypothetical protein